MEHDVTEGFGWIEGDVEKIAPRDESLKIPHMGWNTLDHRATQHPLLDGSRSGQRACTPISCTPIICRRAMRRTSLARADYGGPVTAIVGRDNAVGTQFHPEKSQRLAWR